MMNEIIDPKRRKYKDPTMEDWEIDEWLAGHKERLDALMKKNAETYEKIMKRVPEPEKKTVNWSKIFSGIAGGITVGMLGVMAIAGLMVGTMKTVTKDKN